MLDSEREAASWSNYWLAQVEDAFVVDKSQEQALQALWSAAFAEWRDGDRVLDIGCGNGALARRLGQFADAQGRRFSYLGIDQAALSDAHEGSFKCLQAELRGEAPAETQVFPAASFDRIVSQFGFEYCDSSALIENMRVWLEEGGSFTMLLHSRDSVLSTEVNYTLEQMRMAEESALLVAVARLLSRLDQLAQGASGDRVSAQLRHLVNSICRELDEKAKDMPDPTFLKRFVSLCLGLFDKRRARIAPSVRLANLTLLSEQLLYHQARLEQQRKAALDGGALAKLRDELGARGLRCAHSESFRYESQEIGIVLAGGLA